MGGKVSSKMAAASRVVQVVRPHAPLIKFPNRQATPKPNVLEALKTLVVNPPHSSPNPLPVTAAAPPPISRSVNRLPGTPDSLASVQALPQRYRRRPVAVEEMDFIQRGGPE